VPGLWRHCGDGCAWSVTLRDNLAFERRTVEASFGGVGASLARHGVHDFIVHTIAGNQFLLKVCLPDAYCKLKYSRALKSGLPSTHEQAVFVLAASRCCWVPGILLWRQLPSSCSAG
jgi:hypothetical protein